MTEELWKEIKGFEGYYEISNHGRVRSIDRYVVANKNGGRKLLKSRIMKLTKTGNKNRNEGENKYLVVNLRREGKNKASLVHRLVAEAFIENPNNFEFVNHKDGVKYNNFIDNLEWCTCGDNNIHALENKLRKPRGTKINQKDMQGNSIASFNSVSEASRITGFGRSSIQHCVDGIIEQYKGFIWERI